MSVIISPKRKRIFRNLGAMGKQRPQDVEPCPGEGGKTCGRKADPAIKGHDGIFRCLRCHKRHEANVERETGASPIGSIETVKHERPKPPSSEREERERLERKANYESKRAAIVKKYGTPGRHER